MEELNGILNLYHLSFSSVAISLALALLGGIFFAYTSGYLFWLTQEQRVSAFITGFALTCALSISRLGQPMADWNEVLLFDSLPVFVCFAYFLPALTASAGGCEIFRAVFLVNLFFGWTGVGWIIAMVMAFRPAEHDLYADLNIRLTPFGIVPKNAPIQLGMDDSAVVKRLPAASNVYVPPLRRDL
ncbi:MAG TPA: superinfection immunity protein [Candidatus Binataceae bacterium]|nr:superinfection immunity protein [Candidatus Binataceae bacterium]